MKISGASIENCKERGEWAELRFMERATAHGLRVSRPFGDSARYDVGVEQEGRIVRVQVKSTLYRRRGIESYSLNIHGPRRQLYKKGAVDFFAIYLIPIDTWYIFPFEQVGENFSLHFTPRGRRGKYAAYREAWHLLREATGTKKKCPYVRGNSVPPCEGGCGEKCKRK